MYKKETTNLVVRFLEMKDTYKDYADLVASLCKSILTSVGINFYAIESRVKDSDSLREKIQRKRLQGKIYSSFQDITDLAGVRVIVYFSDDVERVRRILQEEFTIIEKESFRNSKQYHQKRIGGYISEQEVVKLNSSRSRLKEYQQFKGLLCEVQIKSILQHAWSEIEHDIWYKPKVKESDLRQSEIRTLFEENARLIKQVDENFVKIREKHVELLSHHASNIERHELKEIPVNYDTIRAYLMHTSEGSQIDRSIVHQFLEYAQIKQARNLFDLELCLATQETTDY